MGVALRYLGVLATVAGSFGLALPACAAESYYQVVDRQHLPGAAKWDFLAYDADTHRLFITHGDHVDVYNTAKNKLAGTISGTDGVHGVALAPELNHGYTSNGKADTVTIFDLTSLKPLGTARVQKDPDAILYDPGSQQVFVANGESNSLSVLGAEGKNLGTISLGGKPESMAVDRKGQLFVNIEDKNQLVVIDVKALNIKALYDLSYACTGPAGLAIDPDKERLFVGCHNEKLLVVDGDNGKVVAGLPIGHGNDAVAFDGKAQLVLASNGDGTLHIIGSDEQDRYDFRQVVATMPTARTMAIDPESHRVYLVGAEIDHTDKPTKENPHPRPVLKDNTFTLMTVAP